METVIRDYYGKILGRIGTQYNGTQVAKNFHGQILGYYYPEQNETKDFHGRILARGNTLAALIQNDNS